MALGSFREVEINSWRTGGMMLISVAWAGRGVKQIGYGRWVVVRNN